VTFMSPSKTFVDGSGPGAGMLVFHNLETQYRKLGMNRYTLTSMNMIADKRL
jgi:hypothetical protein